MRNQPSRAEHAQWLQFIRSGYPLPAGTVEFGDKPDVTIARQTGLLGIELGTVYKLAGNRGTYSEQAQIPLRKRVVTRAQRHYERLGGPPIRLDVDFWPEESRAIRNAEDLAIRLGEKIFGIVSAGETFEHWNPFSELPEIRYMSYLGQADAPSDWTNLQVYEVPPLDRHRVRDEVAKKVAALAGYRHCDDYWLLLTIDFWDPAQDQSVSWPAEDILDRTPFSKILLHHTHHGVLEIPQA